MSGEESQVLSCELFLGDIEDICTLTPKTHANLIRHNMTPMPIKAKGASFLDLPREIRDEIYSLAVTTDKQWSIRLGLHENSKTTRSTRTSKSVLERLPPLYHAIPIYAHEVLQMHYRQNVLRFNGDYKVPSYDNLLNWINLRSSSATENVRNICLPHQTSFSGLVETPRDLNAYGRPLSNGGGSRMVTTISIGPDNEVEMVNSHFRRTYGSWFRWPRDCTCGIAELVHERLSRNDALSDPLYLSRMDTINQYGPVLGFALQLCEALRLAQEHEETASQLPSAKERREYRDQLSETCTTCGNRRWIFGY